jgi:uncharacterized damage-inducible protein DinB
VAGEKSGIVKDAGRNLMSTDHKILDKIVGQALSGKGAHVEAKSVFEGLDWKAAGSRPEGVPHSLFQLLNHMIYWQDWAVKWLDGKKPPVPEHASGSWPGSPGPASAEDWEGAVSGFLSGLNDLKRQSREADLLTKRGNKSRLEMLHTIASHNSYHAGQAVFLRQMLGVWPPPSGGVTW